MKRSPKTCVDCGDARLPAARGVCTRRQGGALSRALVRALSGALSGALPGVLLLTACGGRDDAAAAAAAPPSPHAVLAVKDAWARAADSGAMTAVYFTITNTATVADTLLGVQSAAAEEVGLHMSMQQGRTMHMAALQSLPVPADDSVLFAPLGAHVMLTRMTRRAAPGDTLALTLTFVSGQSLEVRAGVRQP